MDGSKDKEECCYYCSKKYCSGWDYKEDKCEKKRCRYKYRGKFFLEFLDKEFLVVEVEGEGEVVD